MYLDLFLCEALRELRKAMQHLFRQKRFFVKQTALSTVKKTNNETIPMGVYKGTLKIKLRSCQAFFNIFFMSAVICM